MAKKIVDKDGNVYVAKKRGGCLTWIFILGVFTVIGYLWKPQASDTKPTETQTTVEIATTQAASETPTTVESTENTADGKLSKEDLVPLNVAISDSLSESHKFALGELDENGNPTDNGEPDEDYLPYLLLEEIELQENGALHVTVSDDFKNLSEDEKTLILNTASDVAGLPYFLKTEEQKSFYITALDKNGNKVAQSKMLNVLEYDFYTE